jgi:hypothetical protein
MYLRPGGELVLLDEEDIHGTMGFINSEQTLKSGSQGVFIIPDQTNKWQIHSFYWIIFNRPGEIVSYVSKAGRRISSA